MSAKYAAGTVATVTFNGSRFRALRAGDGWLLAFATGGAWTSDDAQEGGVSYIDPLVVLELTSDDADMLQVIRDQTPVSERRTLLTGLIAEVREQVPARAAFYLPEQLGAVVAGSSETHYVYAPLATRPNTPWVLVECSEGADPRFTTEGVRQVATRVLSEGIAEAVVTDA